MRQRKVILYGVIGLVTVLLYHYDAFGTVFSILLHSTVVMIGISLSVSWSLVQGKQYKPRSKAPGSKAANNLFQKMMEKRTERKPSEQKKLVVISRNIDSVIQDVMDLIIRDYVLSWYTDLSKDQETFTSAVKSDIWILVENLSMRLGKIDKVKFVAEDVVEKLYTHFREVREFTKREDQYVQKKFILQPWLESSETETEFLRKVCNCLLIILLPVEYRGCITIRHLLRDVLTTAVLKPTIDMICDPDYINQKLIDYIDYRHQLSEDTRKTYTYAATYEDFVKMIDRCQDIEHLKQIRYNIITEIIHATTIQNVKKEQTVATEKSLLKAVEKGVSKAAGKGDLLKARNLMRYINQLTVAKTRSEKRIHSLGGPDYKSYDITEDLPSGIVHGQKVMAFEEVMDSTAAKKEFWRFLERDDNQSLLGFCMAVEKLKHADKRKQHQIGKEIFDTYINSSTSLVKLERSTIRDIEAFLLGNSGPEAFDEGLSQVCDVLRTKYYPSFLVSDIYHRYMLGQDESGGDTTSLSAKDKLFFEPDEDDDDFDSSEEKNDDSEIFQNQSYIAKQKLEQIDEKIQNKSQALKALRSSKKPEDTKMEKLEKDLEVELEDLTVRRRHLEAHILRTQMWCENQGNWRAHVYEAEIITKGEKRYPVFVLIVHLAGSGLSQNLQSSSEGWVVSRTISQFYSAHKKLTQIGPWLQKKELPKEGRFTTLDDKFIEDSKKLLNEYLSAVMKDGMMAQSEALYGFLTPTPEYFQEQKLEKKSSFFLKNILKSLPNIGQEKNVPVKELRFIDDEVDGSKIEGSKDSIAEPFYKLVNEVFECLGTFKWLRRSFISFVEVTFGRSINRQLRETVDWIFGESMIIYYITVFKNSMWPNGQLAKPTPVRSDEEKLQSRMEAKNKFLQNLPDAVRTLLGEDNSRRGAIKMFEVLQDVRLNKHLFYILLELLLFKICPEIDITQQKSEKV